MSSAAEPAAKDARTASPGASVSRGTVTPDAERSATTTGTGPVLRSSTRKAPSWPPPSTNCSPGPMPMVERIVPHADRTRATARRRRLSMDVGGWGAPKAHAGAARGGVAAELRRGPGCGS